MKPIDPLGPLHLAPASRPRGWAWPYIVLIVLLGCLLVWLLLARANAPEAGGVREVRAPSAPLR
jgi:hypothetical protein